MQMIPLPLPKLRWSLWLGLGLWAILLPGCKDREAQPAAPGQPTNDAAYVTEEAFPGRSGTTRKGTFLGTAITYEEIDGKAVFEGDILLSPEQLGGDTPTEGGRSGHTEGAGLYNEISRWPHRRIYYTLAADVPYPIRVHEATWYWNHHTMIEFVHRFNNEPDYVTFTAGPGCASAVGRVGGQQFITLGPNATIGNILHEMGHAAGLLHEHTRMDRDTHLTVHWNNIEPGKADYFKPYLFQGYNGFDHRAFDFNSRMLYGARAYALDPTKPTLTRKDGSLYAINTTTLSAGDLAVLNDMYPVFQSIPGQGRDLAGAPNGDVYMIGMQAVNVPFFKGYETFKWNGSDWTKLPVAAVDIDVDAQNRPWIVNAHHEIWRLGDGGWEKLPGEARGIGAGAAGAVHIVSNTGIQGGYAIRRWTGNGWETIPGRGGVAVDVDATGKPWMVDAGKNLHHYEGGRWELKRNHVSNVGIGGDGSVFILDDQVDNHGNYALLKWTGHAAKFLPLSRGAVKVTATGTGTPWIASANTNLYRQYSRGN